MIVRVRRGATAPVAEFTPPSSKSYTARHLLAAALASGPSTLHAPAVQEDSIAMVRCLQQLGVSISAHLRSGETVAFSSAHADDITRVDVLGCGGAWRPTDPSAPLDVANAGTVLRFLLGVGALAMELRFTTDYTESLGKRPNTDLLEALQQLGVQVTASTPDGTLPILLRGGRERIAAHLHSRRESEGINADQPIPITVSGAVSSQFATALLFLAPLLDEDMQFEICGRMRSRPTLEMTLEVLRAAGIAVESSRDLRLHRIHRGQRYVARRWDVPGDWPSAAAMLSAAAVWPGARLAIPRMGMDAQGERLSLDFLRDAGCAIEFAAGPGSLAPVTIAAPETLSAAAINGDLCTDAVLSLLGVAMVADGGSRFVGIRNLQFKECDRVREPLEELRRVYATAIPDADGNRAPAPERALWHEPEDDPDTMHVRGWPAGFTGGIEVSSRGDHRVAMLLSIVALRCRDGLAILDAGQVAKSFPGWFRFLETLGAEVAVQ